jgi:hypothetical protein
MHSPPKLLSSLRAQAVIAGLAAAALAIAGFQTGRYTVDAAAVANSSGAVLSQPPSDVVSRKDALIERPRDRIIIRDIATVPFSELYDVLKDAPREQLLAWARDLEQMPKGPRQRAAVAAYYKSLIQVDHRAAIEAVLHAENLNMRDVAIVSLMKAAPESIWGDLAEMIEQLPHPRRLHTFTPEDPLSNWSRVDPVAVSKFVEKHPDSSLSALLYHWGAIDPAAAREWLERDTSRQTEETFRVFVTGWAEVDRAAVMEYAVANSTRANFKGAVNDLAYYLFRVSPDDASRLMSLLLPEQAKAAMKVVADNTTSVILHAPEDYQRPANVVARWMATQPVDLWKDDIGGVIWGWMRDDADAATSWLGLLQPNARDAAIADLCRRGAEAADDPRRFDEKAIALGLTITDRKLRDEVMGEFARRLGTTRDEAIEAVDQLRISNEQTAYLRNVMPEAVRER